MSVNKVILVGNLGKDPIVKKLDNGRTVTQFTLATNERYKDKSGQTITNTEWHNIVLWTPLAEVAEKYLKKGSQVYIEGKIASREYTDKDNINRRITEIVGREMTMLDKAGSASSNDFDASKSTDDVAYEIKTKSPFDSQLDDDLPF